MATETINGQKYFTGSSDISWYLTWDGYLTVNANFTIYVRVPDDLDHLECWIDIANFSGSSGGRNGGGFNNVCGIMWECGVTEPKPVTSLSSASADSEALASEDIAYVDGVPERMIRGFIVNDSDNSTSDLLTEMQKHTDVIANVPSSYLEGSYEDPVTVALETPGVIPIDQLIVRGFSRWLNHSDASNYVPSWGQCSAVSTIADGSILLDDLFPDYYPWAILKSNVWSSANRAGGHHRMLKNSVWRDDKNNFLPQKDQTVHQLQNGSWVRCDEIGAE